MGSQIKINEIGMDKTDVEECEHFSMRGYVSEMRKKDWKKCCPFPINVFEENSLLPPLEVPKFKRWDCENCRRKIIESDGNHNEAPIVNSDIQNASTIDNIVNRREIDLNQAIDLSHDNEELDIPSTFIEQNNNGETSMMVEQVDGATMEVSRIQENNKMEKDFDLNCPCIIDLDEEEEVDNKNIDGGSFSRKETMEAMNPLNLEYASSYTTGFCAQMPMKNSYPHGRPLGQSSNYFKMSHLSNINNSHYNSHSTPFFGESSSTHPSKYIGPVDRRNISHSFMKNSSSNQICMPKFVTTLEHNKGVSRETLEPQRRFSENYICMHNKNPADFSAPGAGNPYMINGEDLCKSLLD